MMGELVVGMLIQCNENLARYLVIDNLNIHLLSVADSTVRKTDRKVFVAMVDEISRENKISGI